MQIMFLDQEAYHNPRLLGSIPLEEKSKFARSTESKYLSFLWSHNLKVDTWYPCVFTHIVTTPQGKPIRMDVRLTDDGNYRWISVLLDEVNSGFVKFDRDINEAVMFV